MNAVCKLLKRQYPIIQGAMGVICNPELVAAVSNADGFGLLATAFIQDCGIFRDQIQATKYFLDEGHNYKYLYNLCEIKNSNDPHLKPVHGNF